MIIDNHYIHVHCHHTWEKSLLFHHHNCAHMFACLSLFQWLQNYHASLKPMLLSCVSQKWWLRIWPPPFLFRGWMEEPSWSAKMCKKNQMCFSQQHHYTIFITNILWPFLTQLSFDWRQSSPWRFLKAAASKTTLQKQKPGSQPAAQSQRMAHPYHCQPI